MLLDSIGDRRSALVDSINEDNRATLRGFDSAPEIDGVLYLENSNHSIGDVVNVEITDVLGVDRLVKSI